MAEELNAAKTLYGPRKIGQKAWKEQQAEQKFSNRGATVYGTRKGGGGRAGDPQHVATADDDQGATGVTQSGNPFLGDDDQIVTISTMKEVLEANPELLDLAIETEVEQEEPRVGAIGHLKKLEGERPGGPREGLMQLLERMS